ncbi:hypothetical protein BGY98DRAFT_1045857 [Russula aff. rugulosa BPL654]|nr:hypothetical protein BGY98DRAFT_1045857 [Russula aff. rugulosa BPL654]
MVAARNDDELAQVSGGFANVFHTTRKSRNLKKYAATLEAQVHKAFYDKQITNISSLLAVLNGQVPDEGKQSLFSRSSALWDGIKVFIVQTLPTAITEGPFIGGSKSEEGVAVLERRFGPLPEKVKAYWTAWIGRDSWVKAYPNNALH